LIFPFVNFSLSGNSLFAAASNNKPKAIPTVFDQANVLVEAIPLFVD
jgi:hypothetical protein